MAVRTSEKQRERVRQKVRSGEFWHDEDVWTFVVADCLTRSRRTADHFQTLAGVRAVDDVWFQALPLPPRKGGERNTEKNTRLDLAFGAIRQRGTYESGIEHDPAAEAPFVCFVEAKLFSDCSSAVSHDPLRNQLARVAENLLCFQGAGQLPQEVVLVLLTPRLFKQHDSAKLYGYKWREYCDRERLLADIRLSPFPPRQQRGWRYPSDVDDRARRLRMQWACYEDILVPELGVGEFDLTKLSSTPAAKRELAERLRSMAESI